MAKTSTTTQSTPTTSAAKSKYETMIIGVPQARKDTRAKLDDLAGKLGCKNSALIWAAVDMLLAKPPTVAPAGAANAATGSASGFWVVHEFEGTKIKAIRIKEVLKRAEANGRAFFRYTVGDDKGRTRAKNQAIRAAQYDAKVASLNGESVKVAELRATA